ncbi:MAG TPA: ATP-binding protein [Acetobacteraceae bacterium]|nr:ATP-binding protein [Acetobacteraceae bacterium]
MILPAVMRRPGRLIEQLARPLPPLLAALFEDSGTGALVLDRDRRIARTNRRLDAMLAASGTLLVPDGTAAAGRPAWHAPAEALFAPVDRPRVATALAAALRGDPPPPLQVRLSGNAQADAAVVVVALSVAPLHESDGEISGLLLRLTDVSAEKRLEAELAQLQKLQAVGQLAGGIAHDFNNLLTAIGVAADSVLERENCDAVTLDDVRQIRQSADRGAALVRQLLAFGRRQPLQPAVVAVNAAIRDLSDMLVRLLGERIRLQLELEEPGRPVRVDPTQLDRVLVNLAVNARDAMPAGGTLTLRTGHLTLYRPQQIGSETMPPGRYVAIGVEDTGEGIPPATLPLVFEPFFTTRRDRGGNGLGLSTVHGIVRQSGGFVTVDSVVGQGTSVRFWLPRHEETELVSVVPLADIPQASVPQAGAPPAETPGLAAAPPARAATARFVLLVEDEEPVRRLTERALQRAGWRVSAVDSAEAALEWLPRPGDAGGPPCVLVSDIMLPGMDGTELVRAVRAVWPDLPAVLVSGYTDSALLGDLVAHGVSFLAKPFRLRDLLACVEQAVA